MNIYIIEPLVELCQYGENGGYVIAANNENEVIEIALADDENLPYKDKWLKGSIECVGIYTGSELNPFILLDQPNEG